MSLYESFSAIVFDKLFCGQPLYVDARDDYVNCDQLLLFETVGTLQSHFKEYIF